jgi:RNA-splicing ligase RtcB
LYPTFTALCGNCSIDESPMAYKNMDDIVHNIAPTAEIEKIIRPVYNFKAVE